MTKKMIATLILVLAVLACCFAETHTIVLVSRVERTEAQYVIRNRENGQIGSSVVYSTEEIAKQDVRTSFDIIQSNDSNWGRTVEFRISATELKAKVDGKTYSTEGVEIVMDGQVYGSSVEFARTFEGAVAAGTEVGSFEVVWKSNASLVDATYEASITLTATAL